MTKPKRKHTDESKPGPTMAQAVSIAAEVTQLLHLMSKRHPEVSPEAIAMEISAAAWRLTGGAK
jgi:hypothetical protein